MDTSPEYIEMCSQAGEIQNNHQPIGGDWYANKMGGISVLDSNYRYGISSMFLWLPRIDQLIEMIDIPLWKLNHLFTDWLYDSSEEGNIDLHVKHEHLQFKSMEQLWLAVIMDWKFQKRWDGIDWIAK